MKIPASSVKKSASLRMRITLSFIAFTILISGLTTGFIYVYFRNQLRDSLRQRLLSIVTIASLQIDGDIFNSIRSADDPAYTEIWAQNTTILEAEEDLVYLYTMRYDDEGIYFVVDAGDPSGEGFSPYGTRYYEPGPTLLAQYHTLQEPISEESFYVDEYGRFLSAYAPIRSRDGQVTGIIGADISANNIIASERQLMVISVGILTAILPFLILLGWWLGNTLTAPILLLTRAATRIAQGELSYRPFISSRIPEIITLDQAFFSMSEQLKSLIETLEERINNRTEELRQASEHLQTRATQMETIAEVAHSILLVQDITHVLNSVVNIIAERFRFYHTGIFLLDKNRDYAVLSATNSPGGQRMLARGHKLKIGEVGIVGYVAGSGKPRIALDVGKDAIFFNNPDLPETRSEMALPLLVRDSVIGVLDIQSQETAAFREEDINVFRILADQVAIAIENARLFEETTTALSEVEKAYYESIRGGWLQFTHKRAKPAVLYSAKADRFLETDPDYPELKNVIETGQAIAETGNISLLAIPLAIRGYTLGALDIRVPDHYHWSQEEVDTVKRIADRVALALENARLYEDSKLRASKEKIISDISTKITTSINIRNILQTAAEELGRVLPDSEIEIRLRESNQNQTR